LSALFIPLCAQTSDDNQYIGVNVGDHFQYKLIDAINYDTNRIDDINYEFWILEINYTDNSVLLKEKNWQNNSVFTTTSGHHLKELNFPVILTNWTYWESMESHRINTYIVTKYTHTAESITFDIQYNSEPFTFMRRTFDKETGVLHRQQAWWNSTEGDQLIESYTDMLREDLDVGEDLNYQIRYYNQGFIAMIGIYIISKRKKAKTR
jgi:hypothetical protein